MNSHWLALVAAMLAGVTGQILLKLGVAGAGDVVAQLLRPATILGLGFYAAAALLYIIALRGIPMSIAFPAAAAQYVVVAVVGWLAFNEAAGLPQVGGLAMIVGGVLLLALG